MSSGEQLQTGGPIELGDFTPNAAAIVVVNGATLANPMIVAGRVTAISNGGLNYSITFGAPFAVGSAPVVVVDVESTTPYFPAWTVSNITNAGFVLSAGQGQPAGGVTPFPVSTQFACAFHAIGSAP